MVRPYSESVKVLRRQIIGVPALGGKPIADVFSDNIAVKAPS